MAQHGVLEGCPHGEPIGRAEILELPCDMLISALEARSRPRTRRGSRRR
jgi:hypothetical protein